METISTAEDQQVPIQARPDTPPLPLDRTKYVFRHYWFDEWVREDWEQRTKPLHGKKLQVLEIGVYEGASTTWILDNLMSHPESTLTSIDTFQGGMEHHEASSYNIGSLEARFRANVSKSSQESKLTVLKARSGDALVDLRVKGARFDFIYIDGSHTAIDVLDDSVMSWRMLNVGGLMVFDDFTWKGYLEDCYNPRIAIQAFLHCAAPEVEMSQTEGQVWVTKVPNRIRPTPNPDPDLYYWDESAGLKL